MDKKITSALISVFYKDGLEPVVRQLKELGATIYSTGGTQKFIEDLGIDVVPVESLTSYPSILGGRVKTLHPSVFGGILGRRNNETDVQEMQQYNIPTLDLVIVDLYPFEETLAQTTDEKAIIEKIDIGGPSMIRAAAKNFSDVTVIASKEDYQPLVHLLKSQSGAISLEQRKSFAAKAFQVVANYDIAINNYFNAASPLTVVGAGQQTPLRYGENPHQKAVFFGNLNECFDQLHGKEISYNNLVDIDAAIELIREFSPAPLPGLPLTPSQGGGTATTQPMLFEDAAQNTTPLNSWAGAEAHPSLGGAGGGLSSKSGPSQLGAPSPSGGGRRALPYNPFEYKRRETFAVDNIGGSQVPVVIADLSKLQAITPKDLESIGYQYNEASDKWSISDTAADYVFTGHHILNFALPGTLKVIVYPAAWVQAADKEKYFPIYDQRAYTEAEEKSGTLNFVMVDCFPADIPYLSDMEYLDTIGNDPAVVFCLSSTNKNAVQSVRRMVVELMDRGIKNPVVLTVDSGWQTADEHLIHYATEAGALLLDGMGDGVCFGMTAESYHQQVTSYKQVSGRNYQKSGTVEGFINNTAFSILQATRTRISKTEYISCPSCGRTLFDLQETTAKIRAVTNHLKGLKIAIMGCIVNGPGEMADADFGYVGSGVGKITLYKGKEIVKRNVPSEVAVNELINLLKESEVWVEKPVLAS